jgi:hypothetical protein
MTHATQEALNTIMEMDEDDTQRYLMALVERDLELFESIHHDLLQMDFLEELKGETHNGYMMYPELGL